MTSLNRWYQNRERAAAERALQTTRATQLDRSTVPVEIDGETVDYLVPDLLSEGLRGAQAADEAVESVDAVSRVPAQVVGLTEVSNGAGWGVNPEATITLSWTAVTVGLDGLPVEVAYEVFDGDFPIWSGDATSAVLKILSGSEHTYRVRAVSVHGVPGDLSDAVAVTGATPALAPLIPKGLTLVSSMGVVVASWSGEYTTAATAAALNVRVEARVGSSGAWVRQGAALASAGDQAVTVGTTGDTVQVRLVAVDRLGRDTGTSAVSSVTVTGVDLTDLDQAIKDQFVELDNKATAAQSAASGAQSTADTARAEATSKAAAAEAAAKAYADAEAEAARLAAVAAASSDASAKAAAAEAAAKAAAALDAKAKADAAQAAAEAKAQTAQDRADAAFTAATNAATAAGTAQTTANGKNTVWYLATAPAGVGHRKDDVWFDTANGMRMAFWNTTTNTWVVAQFGTQAIANLAITNALIANAAIDNAKIANVDAGKVTTGFLAAARIAAYSLSVTKLAVGSFDNLFQAPHLITGAGETGVTSGAAYTATANPLDLPMLAFSGRDHYSAVGYRWAAKPGEEFVIEAIVKKLQGTASWTLKVAQWNAAGGTPSGTNIWSPTASATELIEDLGDGWGRYRGIAKLTSHPTITTSGFYVVISQGIAGQPALGETVLAVADISVRRRNGGELLVDGAVRARHVEMETGFFDKLFGNEAMIGRVKTNHIDPAVGGQLNLSANETIVLIAGRQDQQDNDLAGVQEQLDTVASDTAAAGQGAADAEAAAAIADGKALVAQAQAQDTSDRLNTQQAVFRVTPTGADVASKDGTNIVRITPTGVQIVQGGTPASTWDAGRLIVSEAIVSRAQLGNHIAEKQGMRTTFRPL